MIRVPPACAVHTCHPAGRATSPRASVRPDRENSFALRRTAPPPAPSRWPGWRFYASRRRSPGLEWPLVPDVLVTVRLFASLREAAGTARIRLRLPEATPVGAVWSHLPEPVRTRSDPPDGMRYALNHEWTLP